MPPVAPDAAGVLRIGRRPVVVTLVLLAFAACAPASPAQPTPSASPPPPPATTGPAASPIALADRLQQALDDVRRATGAPGALGVVVDGDQRTGAASGSLDLGRAEPVSPGARFRIASITKPIIAAIVLTAVDRGELDLDAIVADLVPGVVRPDPPVTVRQLLSHTSGIFDEGNEGDPVADAAALTDPDLRAEADDVLQRYLAGEPVIASDRLLIALAETHDRYFRPGAGYHYSNINYQLAALVAETATGRTIAELLDARIVEPLGLEDTTIAPPDLRSPDLRGYDEAGDGTITDVTDDLLAFGNGGNGGIVSTADELLVMLRAIVRGELFRQELVDEMETPVREAYGLGLGTAVTPCGDVYGHSGSVNGTRSVAWVSPDGSHGIVLAVNLRGGQEPHLESRAGGILCAGK